jgi:hypothetical protein
VRVEWIEMKKMKTSGLSKAVSNIKPEGGFEI